MATAQQEAGVTIKELLESGAHFGHQTHRWNPKMKRFIFEARNGIYIIDLAKTLQQIRAAVQVVREMVGKRKSILFVGTKKQAKAVVQRMCGRMRRILRLRALARRRSDKLVHYPPIGQNARAN